VNQETSQQKETSDDEPEETAPVEEKKEKIVIQSKDEEGDEESMEVETTKEEEVEGDTSTTMVEDLGEFDPKLELSNFKFPLIDLLKDYNAEEGGITINQEELEENKDNIVNTLKNYKIGISQIKATVGPTVTLYEIVPEAGIRIS